MSEKKNVYAYAKSLRYRFYILCMYVMYVVVNWQEIFAYYIYTKVIVLSIAKKKEYFRI